MKKGLLYLLVALALLPVKQAFGQLGIGIQLVDFTALTFKYRLSERQDLEGAIGWYRHEGALEVVASTHLLRVYPKRLRFDDVYLDTFVGLGGKIAQNAKWVEVRLPLGVSHRLGWGLELSAEVIPGLSLVPSTDLDVSVALIARFFI